MNLRPSTFCPDPHWVLLQITEEMAGPLLCPCPKCVLGCLWGGSVGPSHTRPSITHHLYLKIE